MPVKWTMPNIAPEREPDTEMAALLGRDVATCRYVVERSISSGN